MRQCETSKWAHSRKERRGDVRSGMVSGPELVLCTQSHPGQERKSQIVERTVALLGFCFLCD
jgi:hypothetical protein